MIVLTLTSSDSANLYPDNEPGNFKNHLPGELKLEGGNWLIGLARIQIPITWPTLTEDEAAVKIYKPNVLRAVIRVTLPLTHFATIENLIAHLNHLIEQEGKNIQYTQIGGEVRDTRFHLGQDGRIFLSAYNDIIIEMSDKLKLILGLNSNIIETTKKPKGITAKEENITRFTKTSPDISLGKNLIFVYSDIVEEQIVSDIKAPLLGTVPINQNDDSFITYEPKTISWLKPSTTRCQSIVCSLHTIDGNTVPFLHGQVIITLHIKRDVSGGNEFIE